MLRIFAVCVVLALALSCQAGAVTSYINTFNGNYVAGAIGPVPEGWGYEGYGPPAYTQQETGIVQPPNDGTDSAPRMNLIGDAASGYMAFTLGRQYLNNYALPGLPIDWTQPVYLKADIYGADYGLNTMFKSYVTITNYAQSFDQIEWGNDGTANGQWVTAVATINPGQAGVRGKIYLVTEFDFTSAPFGAVNAAIFDNVRIDYTPVPEPASLLALATGMIGLGAFIRRRR